jgi:predicted metal-dependent TIM-barrel fold hydrolase
MNNIGISFTKQDLQDMVHDNFDEKGIWKEDIIVDDEIAEKIQQVIEEEYFVAIYDKIVDELAEYMGK